MNIPGVGFPLPCNFTCRNMPDYHHVYNKDGRFLCPQDVPEEGTCEADNSLCVQSHTVVDAAGVPELVLGPSPDGSASPTPTPDIVLAERTREAREFVSCARLCVEDFRGGTDMHFHPNDYAWNNTHLLPANSSGCDGRLILVIADRNKQVVIHRAEFAAENFADLVI